MYLGALASQPSILGKFTVSEKHYQKKERRLNSNIQSYGLHTHTQHKNYVHADIHANTSKTATKFGEDVNKSVFSQLCNSLLKFLKNLKLEVSYDLPAPLGSVLNGLRNCVPQRHLRITFTAVLFTTAQLWSQTAW